MADFGGKGVYLPTRTHAYILVRGIGQIIAVYKSRVAAIEAMERLDEQEVHYVVEREFVE